MADELSDFSLIPPDVDAVASLDDRLDAAEASLTADPFQEPGTAEETPVPYGVTWSFDYQAGRYRRSGTAPAEVRGEDALIEWIQLASQTARGAHASCPPDFGMEAPFAYVGLADPRVAIAEFESQLRTALLVHDRIEDVIDFSAVWDPENGAVIVETLTVVTDEGLDVAVSPFTAQPDV